MRFAERADAVARLTRLHNGLIAAAGVWVGARWAGAGLAPARATLVALGAIALAAFANSVNDYFDVEIDRIVHPNRPLPAGELSPGAALATAAVAAIVAVTLTALASPPIAVATVAVLAVMVLYSTHLKRSGLVGNVVVAVLASLPIVYGAWSVAAPGSAVPLFLVAMPLHLAREVAKDLDDVAGDRARRRTLPVEFGATLGRTAFVVAMAIFIAALVPVVAHRRLLGALIVPVLALCALASDRVVTGRPGGARLLKTAMVCAMIVFLAIRP
jgi:geranylgeranylglycerol-phosphate geranylgeranyltransferase